MTARKYLTEPQLNQLMKAARKDRYGQRDGALILLMARHGLRVTEAVDLRWVSWILLRAICTLSASRRP